MMRRALKLLYVCRNQKADLCSLFSVHLFSGSRDQILVVRPEASNVTIGGILLSPDFLLTFLDKKDIYS